MPFMGYIEELRECLAFLGCFLVGPSDLNLVIRKYIIITIIALNIHPLLSHIPNQSHFSCQLKLFQNYSS
jgi:GTP:adenosylcobinamide-phosphate guanylyltransferase